MAVRTDVLSHRQIALTLNTFTDLETVPAGEVWLVRSVSLFQATGSTATMILGALRSGVVVRWAQLSLTNIVPQRLDGLFLVAEAGDKVQVLGTVTGNYQVGMYGARLVVP